jgi:hypothetical protein
MAQKPTWIRKGTMHHPSRVDVDRFLHLRLPYSDRKSFGERYAV